MTPLPSRRAVLALAASVLSGGSTWAAEADWLSCPVVALNWALAETLYAMAVKPMGVAEVASYDALIGQPATPAGVVDVGLQGEPNLELLHRLAPDLILIQPWQGGLAEALGRCGRVESFQLFDGVDDPCIQAAEATRRIAGLVGLPVKADRLIDDTEAVFAACRSRLAARDARPILLVQTIDKGSLTVFTRGGLFDAVLARLGLRNAWPGGPSLLWGGTRVGIDRLAADPEAVLVMIAPARPAGQQDLTATALWSHLPAVRAGRVIHLPLFWGFGALPTAARFAQMLTDAFLRGTDACG